MTINIDKNLIGIWFVPLPESDWMGSIQREQDHFRLTYRFRYYKGDQDKRFEESEDEKQWKSMISRPGESEETLLKVIRDITSKLARAAGTRVFELRMEPDMSVDEFADLLMAQEWTHSEKRDIH